MDESRGKLSCAQDVAAFTLIELLCVIGIIALLAGHLLPALSKAKTRSQAVVCTNSKSQLTLAWLMYVEDNRDLLAPNFGGDRLHALPVRNWDDNWVNNRMSWELESDNTNLAFIQSAKFTPYTTAVLPVYGCPADHVLSDVQRKHGWTARVRNISMNGMLGDPGPSLKAGSNVNNPEYVQFFKISGIPQPADIFVLLDEHPDSINDGYFLNVGDSDEWTDLPGSTHDGSATLSFADGHCELHRWRNAETKKPARPDFDWLTARTSVERQSP